jgi:hypothetical protein
VSAFAFASGSHRTRHTPPEGGYLGNAGLEPNDTSVTAAASREAKWEPAHPLPKVPRLSGVSKVHWLLGLSLTPHF